MNQEVAELRPWDLRVEVTGVKQLRWEMACARSLLSESPGHTPDTSQNRTAGDRLHLKRWQVKEKEETYQHPAIPFI